MVRDERKVFFFEKKKQKDFYESGRAPGGKAAAKTIKSFLVLFFKKEHPL
jgi:hypothetical protein